MTRKLKGVAAIFLAFVLVFTLAACGGGLSGTYYLEGTTDQYMTFSGNTVTMSSYGIEITGTYKIENNQITITYNLLGSEYSDTQSFTQNGNTINYGGSKFVKK